MVCVRSAALLVVASAWAEEAMEACASKAWGGGTAVKPRALVSSEPAGCQPPGLCFAPRPPAPPHPPTPSPALLDQCWSQTLACCAC